LYTQIEYRTVFEGANLYYKYGCGMTYKDGSLVDMVTKWQMDRTGSGLHSMAA